MKEEQGSDSRYRSDTRFSHSCHETLTTTATTTPLTLNLTHANAASHALVLMSRSDTASASAAATTRTKTSTTSSTDATSIPDALPATTTTPTATTWSFRWEDVPKEVRNLVAGGVAGMTAKTFVAPLDRIKIMYQVTDAQFYWKDLPSVMSRIVQTEGSLAALWRGNTATMIRVFPYAGIQFMVFDRCKSFFLMRKRTAPVADHAATVVGDDEHCTAPATLPQTTNGNDNSTFVRRITNNWFAATSTKQKDIAPPESKNTGLSSLESLVSGSLAGGISVICTYPLDLTRAQMALKCKETSRGFSFVSVLVSNFRNGGIMGLYQGITPTLLGILPYAGIAFTINEQTKRKIREVTGREPTTLERLMGGALSGLVAQSVTYPLEVTRRRMQTSSLLSEGGVVSVLGGAHIQTTDAAEAATTPGAAARQGRPSMGQVMIHLLHREGWRGFFKGLSVNWLKGPVAFAISFTTYDKVQAMMTTKETTPLTATTATKTAPKGD